jgi:hypothetical protein
MRGEILETLPSITLQLWVYGGTYLLRILFLITTYLGTYLLCTYLST